MDEASISTLIWLDATITNAVDNLQQCISGSESQPCRMSLAEVQCGSEAAEINETEPNRLTNKGIHILQLLAERLKVH